MESGDGPFLRAGEGAQPVLTEQQRRLRARKARAVRFGDTVAAEVADRDFRLSKIAADIIAAGVTLTEVAETIAATKHSSP